MGPESTAAKQASAGPQESTARRHANDDRISHPTTIVALDVVSPPNRVFRSDAHRLSIGRLRQSLRLGGDSSVTSP